MVATNGDERFRGEFEGECNVFLGEERLEAVPGE